MTRWTWMAVTLSFTTVIIIDAVTHAAPLGRAVVIGLVWGLIGIALDELFPSDRSHKDRGCEPQGNPSTLGM